jgi:predicted MFS family arabinose efflux permease
MRTDKLFLAVATGKFISVLGLLLMPVQIGAMIDGLGLGEAAIGFLATLEFSALGAGLIFVAINPLKTSALRYALIGAALIITGQIASALVTGYGVLTALRCLVGFGAGLANAAATVTIAANFREPERTAGYAFGLVYLVGGALYLASPYMTGYGYHKGVFLSLAVVVLVCIPLLFALPDTPLKKKKRAAAGSDAILSTAAFLLFTAEVFLMVGMGAAWAFGERMGLAVNLTTHEIGFYFACTMIASIAGSLFAGWLGTRYGRTLPFVVCTVLVAICCWFMANPGIALVYVICLLSFQVFQALFIPFLIGTGAALESSGRLSAAVVAVEIFSFGAGGVAGGVVVEAFGLAAVGWLAALGGIVAIPLLIMVCLPLDRRDNGDGLQVRPRQNPGSE